MSGQLTPQDVELEARRLSVEVERLRAELDHAAVQHAAMQTELERLRGINDTAKALDEVMTAQRDVLADALEQYCAFFNGWGMVRENLGAKGKAHLEWVEKQGEAALRLVGRLSREES